MTKHLLFFCCYVFFCVSGVAQTKNIFNVERNLTVSTPTICMVSVDTPSVYNMIYWDSTLYTPLIDSFIAYREVSSGVYQRIGSTLFKNHHRIIDTARSVGPANGDPNIGSYRYKLQVCDSLGNYSALSS